MTIFNYAWAFVYPQTTVYDVSRRTEDAFTDAWKIFPSSTIIVR